MSTPTSSSEFTAVNCTSLPQNMFNPAAELRWWKYFPSSENTMHFHEALTIIITEREHFKKKKEKENETNILEFLTSATKILATFYIGFNHKIFFKLVFTIEALVFYIFHTYLPISIHIRSVQWRAKSDILPAKKRNQDLL